MTKNRIQHALGKLNGYFDGHLNIFFQIVFTFYLNHYFYRQVCTSVCLFVSHKIFFRLNRLWINPWLPGSTHSGYDPSNKWKVQFQNFQLFLVLRCTLGYQMIIYDQKTVDLQLEITIESKFKLITFGFRTKLTQYRSLPVHIFPIYPMFRQFPPVEARCPQKSQFPRSWTYIWLECVRVCSLSKFELKMPILG